MLLTQWASLARSVALPEKLLRAAAACRDSKLTAWRTWRSILPAYTSTGVSISQPSCAVQMRLRAGRTATATPLYSRSKLSLVYLRFHGPRYRVAFKSKGRNRGLGFTRMEAGHAADVLRNSRGIMYSTFVTLYPTECCTVRDGSSGVTIRRTEMTAYSLYRRGMVRVLYATRPMSTEHVNSNLAQSSDIRPHHRADSASVSVLFP